MKYSILFVLVLSVLAPSSARAVDINGNYAVWGVGKKSCFGFNQAYAGDDIGNYKHYIKGFLTAYNIFTEKTYSISGKMNENQVLEWIVSYCEDNPMSTLEYALTSFTFDHYDKRMKTSGSRVGR